MAIIAITICSFAQNQIGITDDIRNFALANNRFNTATITTFSNAKIKGNQYLVDQWSPGSVTTTDNITFSKNYLFNFDKIHHDLYAKFTDQPDLSIILDKVRLKSFSIGNMNFINSGLIDPNAKDVFYQVLVKDSAKVTLYKFNKTKFVKADPTNLMNIKTNNFSSEYVDNPTYYISISNGELKKVNLSENSIRKVLKEKSKQLDSYFSMNNKEVDESLLIDVVDYVNQ